jgi:hypothetical protein
MNCAITFRYRNNRITKSSFTFSTSFSVCPPVSALALRPESQKMNALATTISKLTKKLSFVHGWLLDRSKCQIFRVSCTTTIPAIPTHLVRAMSHILLIVRKTSKFSPKLPLVGIFCGHERKFWRKLASFAHYTPPLIMIDDNLPQNHTVYRKWNFASGVVCFYLHINSFFEFTEILFSQGPPPEGKFDLRSPVRSEDGIQYVMSASE